MKLLYRISITILCIVFTTSLILSVYSFQTQRTLINNQLVKKGQVLANVLSRSVISHLINYDFYTIKLLFDPLEQDDDILSVALIGPDDIIKMHSDLNRLGDRSEHIFKEKDFQTGEVIVRKTSEASHVRYLFFSIVEVDHNRAGYIRIAMSDRDSLRLIESFGTKIVFLTLGVLMTAVLAAYLMSRQISRPIIELSEEIERFMMKRSSYPAVTESSNEISMLKMNFKAMMAELEESIEFRVKNDKMAVLGNLSSVLAHEVKNPLEPIKGSAELLKLKHPDNPDILKYTDIIQSEVSELIVFLDSFLDVADTSRIDMTALDINQTLRDILVLLEYSLNKENMEVRTRLDTHLKPVKGNSGMIKQVFLNLLLNAVQARNGKYGLIEIDINNCDTGVFIKVKDYGCGVEEAIREQIFQPFFTTKEEGSGIGLSISRYLVEQHGGTIRLNSEYGSWTEVCIQLPEFKKEV
jgi:signal transduction histidine kinase